MLSRHLLCSILMVFLFTIAVQAETPVFFTFISEDGHYNFDGGFSIKADPSVVWDVLTDYNHYNRYIANIKARVVQGKPGDDLLVDQDAGGGFLFIQEHIKARLDVHQVPEQSISFQDVDHKQFALYAGVWTIQPDPSNGEVKVAYVLQAARNKATPDFLTSDLFGGSIGDLLNEMKVEMARRQARKDKNDADEAKKTATPLKPTATAPGN
jgi:ribosome-associated toxin RatA of RatAB toxin-antitoxin module